MHFREENKEKLIEIISQNKRLYETNLKLQKSLELVEEESKVNIYYNRCEHYRLA